MKMSKSWLVGLLALLVPVVATGLSAYADDPVSNKEASPSLKERLVQESVKGEVLTVEDDSIVVKESDGRQVRLHVDKTTKMDKVMPGDRVKGYMTEQGHATTIERLQ